MSSTSPLHRLFDEQGQSPWIDNLRRGYLTSGHLVDLIRRGARGLTSNPTIFQKAIQGSREYDDQFTKLVVDGREVIEIYWELVLRDIHGALDAFSELHAASDGRDGFVSVEVDPSLAFDGDGTLTAARSLHERIDRPNVMIKIPATPQGIPAIRRMISEGRNVNVTLIFSLGRYAEVIEAYISGLEDRAVDPHADLSQINSVASFFISRVDSVVDAELTKAGGIPAQRLAGKAAVAQARLAYELFAQAFSGPRWEALEARGAVVQRPLWASTSTKNPVYPDTMYVDQLIGPNTVNTLPDATFDAFESHGRVARTVDADTDEAHVVWSELAAAGIDMNAVAERLESEGVASFQQSFVELIDALSVKMSTVKQS